MSQKNPVRILQVVGGMPRHGSETWLMNVLRHIDRQQFQMDFLVHTLEPHAYDSEIRALGSRVIPCLHPSNPWQYAKNFRRVVKDYGAYDIVHSHIHHYSGFVLRLAYQAGIPVRIAHSHSDTSQSQNRAKLPRKFYLWLMNRWISHYATLGLSVSKQAASALFSAYWSGDSRWKILHCGVDLTAFEEPADPAAIRAELGISPSAFVIGHVGRFVEVKNHTFLLDVLAEVVKREPEACLLLAGEGSLSSVIEHKVARLGLTNHVIFAGLRLDVPNLMKSAMDVFLFPSLYEGLPLSLIEAQAAGLPCLVSDVITEEADILMHLVHRLSLTENAQIWAEIVLAAQKKSSSLTSPDPLEELKQSDFNILNGIRKLEELYVKNYYLN